MIHLEVAVAAPINQTLTYALDTGLDSLMPEDPGECAGKRVLVPLSGRRVTGYVVAARPGEKTDFTVRNIIRFLDERPLFHQSMIPFLRWVADYYHYPLGLVIKAALPGGLSPQSVKKLILSKNPPPGSDTTGGEKHPWLATLLKKGQLTASETSRLLGDAVSRKIIKKLEGEGAVRIEQSVQQDGTREKLEVCYSFSGDDQIFTCGSEDNPADFKKWKEIYSTASGYSLKLSETRVIYCLSSIRKVTGLDRVPLKDIRAGYAGAAKALNSLEEKGLVVRSSVRVYRSPSGEQLCFYPRPEKLTGEQTSAVAEISGALALQKFKPFLLHGVTGCGKTEVYLRAAEITLDAGRDVLFLVPEIALATQLEAHLVSRFGDLVVLLHSGMTKAERFDQYHMALEGRARVVVGARSALFAPLQDPGLIVVDEEHDSGFKQDDTFRYHGRDMAVVRAKFHNAVILLGSATPSITSYANALSGKYTLLSMTKRVGERPLPEVSIVDLNNRIPGKKRKIIRSELLAAMTENLQQGSQSILLLNRRGFSSALLCKDCGTPVQCSHCHVSLTLHKKSGKLLCHYCGFSIAADTVCVECRSTALAPAGFGIERVEEEVRELFPDARVARLDSDTAADRKKFLQILSAMHKGTVDILIGTQMIAKGHHFPNVTLVGVVWADGGISMPDFRAAEKTFQLITQVTGRAGRGELPGKVIIQTLRPDHYALVYAKEHQYLQMFEHEMRLRRSPPFPPYVRLTAIRIQGRVETDVQKSAVNVGRYLRRVISEKKVGITVLGPAPAPLDKIRDNYRWQLLLKCSNVEELSDICIALYENRSELAHRRNTVIIDVDPDNMM
jgi:primosomal protein N' (replication factor Y)